jgi:hypothetical protein
MNQYVERFNQASIVVLDHLSISLLQTFLLALAILCFSFWLMTKNRIQLWSSLLLALLILSLRSLSFYQEGRKSVLLVYNIPKWRAVEIIYGHSYLFMGDQEVILNKTLFNFNLYPSHVQNRILKMKDLLPLQSFTLKNYRISVCDGQVEARKNDKKNILVITGKKRLEINSIVSILKPMVVVIDGSVPAWKSKKIRSELDILKTNYHDVSEKGAFLMEL